MCKAIEEMLADAKAEGENLGLTQGRLEGKFESLAELVKDGILDINEAASRVDMSVEEFENQMKKI